MCLTRPFPFRLARLVLFSADAQSFPSRRSAEKATRAARSRLAERPPRGMRGLALTERARRYRSCPAGWTSVEIMLRYRSSGDHVAKSRVEVATLSRSL